MIKAIIAVIIGAVVLIVVMSTVDKNITGGGGSEPTDVTTYPVSIEGQVNKEGTYYIKSDGTLADLIEAAGGVTGNADARAYNLDYELKNIARLIEDYDIPMNRIETVYNYQDIEQLRLRLEAFSEILSTRFSMKDIALS